MASSGVFLRHYLINMVECNQDIGQLGVYYTQECVCVCVHIVCIYAHTETINIYDTSSPPRQMDRWTDG